MSLGQLTANYTDSEGEDEGSTRDTSPHSPVDPRVAELRESNRPTPSSGDSMESVGSGANTPQKKLSRLVSYINEDEDDLIGEDDEETEPDDLLSEPMDTGTEGGEDDKAKHDPGIKLPQPPLGKCSKQLQDKVGKFVNEVKRGNKDYNAFVQSTKQFRNPSIYEKLVDLLQLDEMGTNYPLEMFDPHSWSKSSYYDELARVQKEEMDKREKERKEKTKVDIISGTKKPAEEEAKKRKSRFDQVLIPSSAMKPVMPPALTTVPSGTKTTIDAFGSLKKIK